MATFSVSVRLQRVTVEATRVSVPLTADLLRQNTDEGETPSIDADKLLQAAINLGRQPSTKWMPDGEQVITAHPLQTPPD